MTRLKNIAVSTETYEKLRNLGRTADSFNDVIAKLLKNQNIGDIKDVSV